MRVHELSSVAHPITWVLVADGRQAQVYERMMAERRIPIGGSGGQTHYEEALTQELLPVDNMAWQAESVEIYEMGRNATGMVFASGGSDRHLSEPHIDVRDEVKQHFIKKIATNLNDAAMKKTFDRIILVAPAKIMGELRISLSKEVMRLVVAELPKDLTHYKGEELIKHLEDIM